ncbi:MAG: hypothetical protein WAN81_15285 [Candidatus Binataceae bacterium]
MLGGLVWPASIGRRAPVAAILTDSIRSEIMLTAANEARLVLQLDAVRPFGSPAFAASVLLHRMADKIVVAVLS